MRERQREREREAERGRERGSLTAKAYYRETPKHRKRKRVACLFVLHV